MHVSVFTFACSRERMKQGIGSLYAYCKTCVQCINECIYSPREHLFLQHVHRSASKVWDGGLWWSLQWSLSWLCVRCVFIWGGGGKFSMQEEPISPSSWLAVDRAHTLQRVRNYTPEMESAYRWWTMVLLCCATKVERTHHMSPLPLLWDSIWTCTHGRYACILCPTSAFLYLCHYW